MVAGEEESVGVEVGAGAWVSAGALASEGALPHGPMLGEEEEDYLDVDTTRA